MGDRRAEQEIEGIGGTEQRMRGRQDMEGSGWGENRWGTGRVTGAAISGAGVPTQKGPAPGPPGAPREALAGSPPAGGPHRLLTAHSGS